MLWRSWLFLFPQYGLKSDESELQRKFRGKACQRVFSTEQRDEAELIKQKSRINDRSLVWWTPRQAVGSLVAQMVKILPAMQETRIRPLGWEDPLEEGMATYSHILAWRIPWTEESSGLQSMGSQKSLI